MTSAITSLKDEHMVLVRSLSTRVGRVSHGLCLLEGAAVIEQAVRAGSPLRFAVCAEGPDDDFARFLTDAGVRVAWAKESLLRQAMRMARPVQWVAVAELPAECGPDDPYGEFALVLDDVVDPGNLGSIVRTACAFGVPDIVLTDKDADLSSRRVLDASRATVLRTRVHRFGSPVEAVESLQSRGFRVVATSPRGEPMRSARGVRDRPIALVVGNETEGVAEQVLGRSDVVVRIPMADDVESLNVSVATGVGIYELYAR
jgi:RNA methyltransferase, TrmH family